MLLDTEASDVITILRLKDRFTQPTAGGWADCMVNFSFNDDQTSHVCELQIVHEQLMLARKGLGGHSIYSKGRAASELLNLVTAIAPTKTKIMIALLCFKSFVTAHKVRLNATLYRGNKQVPVKPWAEWVPNVDVCEWGDVVLTVIPEGTDAPEPLPDLFDTMSKIVDSPHLGAFNVRVVSVTA